MAESTPRDVHYHNDAPHFFSKSGLAKYLKIRPETVREAVKSGALKMRHLPGRVRPIITHPDKEQWIASLEQANGPVANTDSKSGPLTGTDSKNSG